MVVSCWRCGRKLLHAAEWRVAGMDMRGWPRAVPVTMYVCRVCDHGEYVISRGEFDGLPLLVDVPVLEVARG